ncbi:pilus assembly protein TadG-related protein [Streptomyces sp. NBC_01622]|uniref:pilus assembly protein TadG-related protein n=1 Tax=Streptomyces sp. NBC_01622 TaxID=2975903 RepID=UPI003867CF7C|nr:pilus assembly protein TadG-related protein [Streptomyces sp. NBC_01622]
MTRPSRYGDAGQAFPIYITVVGGLLFLALAYFAVGQATVNRSGAQTAADAAALAAAQDTRKQLADEWVTDILDPTKWQDVFHGKGVEFDGCGRADQLAAQNDANVLGCNPNAFDMRYDVNVQTTKTMGKSIVPVTAGKRSKASAAAVIEPLCTFELPGAGAGNTVLPQLTCKDGRKWDVDPTDPTGLPGPEDLFDVHLAD